jgi:hypothetical protein
MSAGKIFGIFGLFVFMVGAMFVFSVFSFHQNEVGVRVVFENKIEANKTDFDNMWKTIQQVAQVPAAHKDGFMEVMNSYAAARSAGKGEGSFLSIMNEAVPDFTGSTELFAKVQTVVEAKREAWTTRQKELIALKSEHDLLIRQLPGSVYATFLGRDALTLQLVTSGRTDEAFSSGKDENVDLFGSGS